MTQSLSLTFFDVGGGQLAVTHRPKLKLLPAMREAGVTHLVTLLSEREGARTVGTAARATGLTWVWVALENGSQPPAEQETRIRSSLTDLVAVLHDGGRIVVHCSAGIHRTGMFSYALLRAAGLTEQEARSGLGHMRSVTAEGVGEQRLGWADQGLVPLLRLDPTD
jgi:protein-tyrosine phosphatase